MSDVLVRKKQGLRKQIFTKHQETEHLYRSLFDHNPDAVYAMDLEGNFLSGNPMCEELFGYRLEELRTMTLPQLVEPSMLESTLHHFQQAASGALQEYQSYFIHKLGYSLQVYIKNFPVVVDGQIVGVYGIVRDLTRDTLKKERLRESEERYRRLVEHSPETVMICRDGIIVYINQAGVKLLGATTKEELIGRPVFAFIEKDYHDKIVEQLHKVAECEEVELIEQKFIRLDGKIIDVEVKGINTIYQEQPAVHVIVRDITERKRTQELLQNSEKLTLVGQLAAGIAHEIRNPLTALKGFLQLMQTEGCEKQEYFSIMSSELARIELIVSELLVLAKPHNTSFRERDLTRLLRHVVTLLETEAILKKVQIQLVFETEVPPIFCDENQLKQAFINFLKNGIEAMPNGGDIVIRVRCHGDQVIIRFEDSGVGIPEEQIAKLGEPFFTTKEKGTGLGLMISYRIIENHRGQLRMMSKPGEGTTVEVTIPAR